MITLKYVTLVYDKDGSPGSIAVNFENKDLVIRNYDNKFSFIESALVKALEGLEEKTK